jgi:hypothetical protein
MVRAIFHESASYLTIPLQSLRAGPIARVRCRAATFVATLFHRDVKACAVTYAAHHGFVAGIGEIRRGQNPQRRRAIQMA